MTTPGQSFDVVGASIADIAQALERGAITSVALVMQYLNRIAFYDRHGIRLNAVPVLNPQLFADAAASDDRRRLGASLGPLDGIPYTAKDSYAVRGLPVAAGSPAFEKLIARDDAFAIGRLRSAGAVLIGLTNMPPMANGGMQRGLYGRAESPYNADYLTAAFASGSSNGSGTATAASFAAFGLAEETWSSGRAPASNNALVAYTPSRGVISVRGNWPLVPTMDVVVPHTRSVSDLLVLLHALVDDDPVTRGDFWRSQPWVALARASDIRPSSYGSLRDATALAGRRLAVPRMYLNRDPESSCPIETRDSVIELFTQARLALEALGAEVVEVDFAVLSNYERDRPGALSMVDRGIVPAGFAEDEIWRLSMFGLDDFLDANNDPNLNSLGDVRGELIFPHPIGALDDRYGDHDFDMAEYVTRARADGIVRPEDIPTLAEGIRGLETIRTTDFEGWLDTAGIDAVIFPAVADVGRANSDTDPDSAAEAWRNGTWVANGNQMIRHLGIPTVTVPMGLMTDIQMPVGLTFAGRSRDDNALIRFAYAFENVAPPRAEPPRTPRLPGVADSPDRFDDGVPPVADRGPAPVVTLSAESSDPLANSTVTITVTGTVSTNFATIQLYVDGVFVRADVTDRGFSAETVIAAHEHTTPHSEWRQPYGSLVTVLVTDPSGAEAAAMTVTGGII